MSYCLKNNKKDSWVTHIGYTHFSFHKDDPITLSSDKNIEKAKFFKNIETIYDGFKDHFLCSPITLNNYKSLLSDKVEKIKDFSIYYEHYCLKKKPVEVCKLDLEKIAFYHLFPKMYGKDITRELDKIGKKNLLSYDSIVTIISPMYSDAVDDLEETFKEKGINAYFPGVRPLRFFLIDNDDLNFAKLSFENFIEITYIHKTSEIWPLFKQYKKIVGEFKTIEKNIDKFLCITNKIDSTYKTGTTNRNSSKKLRSRKRIHL